jgi:DNA polymerase II small subunit/DNA polymerase delta subunit B
MSKIYKSANEEISPDPKAPQIIDLKRLEIANFEIELDRISKGSKDYGELESIAREFIDHYRELDSIISGKGRPPKVIHFEVAKRIAKEYQARGVKLSAAMLKDQIPKNLTDTEIAELNKLEISPSISQRLCGDFLKKIQDI